MADLFLHLPFARRLRFAEGLHPIAGEAVGRRPSLVVLGAALACLPENERRGMSWFRRLFSGGGEAARWQKLLAPTPGQPHVDVIVSLLTPEDAALGPLARLALGLGVLSHEILEEKIGALTSSLQGPQRAGVERAQARLWLQSAVPQKLEMEWKPALDLADIDANKRALQHVDRALKRVHGSGPGEAALGRWLKGLAAEVGPLAEARGPGGALPPSLTVSDSDARAQYFDQAGFVEKAQSAVGYVVNIANRLGEAFTKNNPDRAAIVDALGKLAERAPEIDSQRGRWKDWLKATLEAAQNRGRNPKPAYFEGMPMPEQKLGSLTGVMRLSDLPPEAQAVAGAPPVPEQSEPLPKFAGSVPGMPAPPNTTQEVSVSQIQAEAQAFQAPAHTQEVSIAQIEHLEKVAEAPDSTQEVQTAQVVDAGPSGKTTQPISQAEIERQNAQDEAERAAKAPEAPPAAEPPPSTEPPQAAAPSDEGAGNHANGADPSKNGVGHAEPAAPAETPPGAAPQDPPRE